MYVIMKVILSFKLFQLNYYITYYNTGEFFAINWKLILEDICFVIL